MIIGFTGTKLGMTDAQWDTLAEILLALDYDEAHHGDCIGADAEFFLILCGIREETGRPCKIISHPSTIKATNANTPSDVIHEPLPPLERDAIIARKAELMFATPRGFEEEVRSGTWTTVRRAREAGTPLKVIWPDGSVSEEKGNPTRLE
jgi:hypothetical protein